MGTELGKVEEVGPAQQPRWAQTTRENRPAVQSEPLLALPRGALCESSSGYGSVQSLLLSPQRLRQGKGCIGGSQGCGAQMPSKNRNSWTSVVTLT